MNSQRTDDKEHKEESFLTKTDRSLAESLTSLLLWPPSLIYGLIVTFRRLFYRSGLFSSERFASKVVSIGGLTLGGAGKTPVLIHIAEMLEQKCLKVLILTRGYGGENAENRILRPGEQISDAGLSDEVRLMRRRTRGTIGIGPDRVKSYRMATEADSFDVVLLDDGFQHLKIRRDLNILVLDSLHPFGNRLLLPSGNLREPRSAMRYADLVVVAKAGAPGTDKDAIVDLIRLKPEMPIVTAAYALDRIIDIFTGDPVAVEEIESQTLFAFTSIALPETFHRTVEECGLEVKASRAFRDHHIYTQADIRELVREAKVDDCRAFIVTEKDEVKLGGLNFDGFPVYSLRIRLQITGGQDSLEKLVAGTLNDQE